MVRDNCYDKDHCRNLFGSAEKNSKIFSAVGFTSVNLSRDTRLIIGV